ncbi:hypothetical protein HQ36_03860 [Porphyromonas gingivicanis]|uniref:Uncharacterized protein n=1 Tax=Porphyromonas gingivicanis TaxID=266762 RepID=A0A0A2G6I3_9PORP|nr:hypothetical protein HQ36_03860 [Porphyromonas gingivicanis]
MHILLSWRHSFSKDLFITIGRVFRESPCTQRYLYFSKFSVAGRHRKKEKEAITPLPLYKVVLSRLCKSLEGRANRRNVYLLM